MTKIKDIYNLIPKNKADGSHIEELKSVSINDVEPILGNLLTWLQDLNWPVAQELIKVLPRFHSKLIPHIITVFRSDDDIWKNWVLVLIERFPVETTEILMPEIKRIIENPTETEIIEETDLYAKRTLKVFGLYD